MPNLSNHDYLMELLRMIQGTTKEPHTLESAKEAQQIVQHGHIRLMQLLLDLEDITKFTKEPGTLERVREALRIVEHPHTQLEVLLLNILKTTKEDHTLRSVKEAMQIVQHPQHQFDRFEPYTDEQLKEIDAEE